MSECHEYEQLEVWMSWTWIARSLNVMNMSSLMSECYEHEQHDVWLSWTWTARGQDFVNINILSTCHEYEHHQCVENISHENFWYTFDRISWSLKIHVDFPDWMYYTGPFWNIFFRLDSELSKNCAPTLKEWWRRICLRGYQL